MGQKSSIACPREVPEAHHYFQNLTTLEIVFISISVILTIIVFILYLEVIIRHFSNRPAARRATERNRPAWLLGLYPTFCFTALIAICVPKTSSTNDLIAAIYLSMCIFKFYRQLVWYYGGPDEMVNQLNDKIVELRGAPCCCCCFCLPGIIIDKTALKFCHSLIAQVIVIRPLCAYSLTMMTLDGHIDTSKANAATTVIQVIQAVSTFVAMYGVLLLYRASRVPLQHRGIVPKFALIQFVLVFSNLQSVIINILVAAKVIKCNENLIAKALGQHINHHLIIVEMFILMIVARKIYVDQNRKRAYDMEQKNEQMKADPKRVRGAPGGPNGQRGRDNQAHDMGI